jgi:molybdopterin-guanine dinucleotide biosynthesis protein A
MQFFMLSGGRSSRMGRNKALLMIAGERLIERVLSAIPDRFREEAIIVTNNPSDYDFIANRKLLDIKPGLGPIGGIHAGLSHATTDACFFLACDFPYLTADTIERIIHIYRGQDIFGAMTKHGEQTLCAIYSKRILPLVEKQIESGHYSLRELASLASTGWQEVDPEDTLFNLNTFDEYKKILASGRRNAEETR